MDGENMIRVDTEHNLEVVARWLDNRAHDEFLKKVVEAVR